MLFPYLSSVCRCTILRIVAMVLGIAMEVLQPDSLLISMVLLTNLVPPLHSMGLMHAAATRYLASQRTPYLSIDTSPSARFIPHLPPFKPIVVVYSMWIGKTRHSYYFYLARHIHRPAVSRSKGGGGKLTYGKEYLPSSKRAASQYSAFTSFPANKVPPIP